MYSTKKKKNARKKEDKGDEDKGVCVKEEKVRF